MSLISSIMRRTAFLCRGTRALATVAVPLQIAALVVDAGKLVVIVRNKVRDRRAARVPRVTEYE